ncbi:hypothetical protein [Bordetella genomosp. 8]|nr:hypothetical protein [Bordetella genomosp. 8]
MTARGLLAIPAFQTNTTMYSAAASAPAQAIAPPWSDSLSHA